MTYLEDYLRPGRRVVLLFSGGLDSSLLLAAGARSLGSDLTALTFTGPHTTPGELAAAWKLARKLKVRHLIRGFDPLALAEFRENSPRRCYACKKAMLTEAWEIARAQGAAALWDGANLDDLEDFRPGMEAARELGVNSPLLTAGLGKTAIRRLSRTYGLNAQKAPQSCLATRFPFYTPLNREELARVGRVEAWLRRRGFTRVRLRIREGQARLELPAQEWAQFLNPAVRRPFMALVNCMGWEWDGFGGGG